VVAVVVVMVMGKCAALCCFMGWSGWQKDAVLSSLLCRLGVGCTEP